MTHLKPKTAAEVLAYGRSLYLDGVLYNVDYQEFKSHIASRAFEKAVEAKVNETPSGEVRWTAYCEFDAMYLHNLPGKLARLEKISTKRSLNAAESAYLDVYREWLPVAELLARMKTEAVKTRKPRTEELKTPARTLDHTGTCVCGKNVKLDGAGRLVDHGFTLEYASRNGHCHGVGYLPVEVSRELLDATLDACRAQLARLEKHYANRENWLSVATNNVERYIGGTVPVYVHVNRGDANFGYWHAKAVAKAQAEIGLMNLAVKDWERHVSEWAPCPLPDGDRRHLPA